jgi:hypothetical protein
MMSGNSAAGPSGASKQESPQGMKVGWKWTRIVRSPWVVVALLLAGCAGGPLTTEPFQQTNWLWDQAIDAENYMGRPPSEPLFGLDGPRETLLFHVLPNATANGFALRVTNSDGTEEAGPLQWKLLCTIEGSDCMVELPNGVGTTPLDIATAAIIPARAVVSIWTQADEGFPLNQLEAPYLHFDGVVHFVGGPPLLLQRQVHPIDFVGFTGPCVYIAETDCDTIGSEYYLGPWPGAVVSFNLTFTWDPVALDEEISVWVSCAGTPDTPCPGRENAWYTSGPSPLVLTEPELNFEPARLTVTIHTDSSTPRDAVGDRSEVHVVGDIVTESFA